jgi:hypothetical protein
VKTSRDFFCLLAFVKPIFNNKKENNDVWQSHNFGDKADCRDRILLRKRRIHQDIHRKAFG